MIVICNLGQWETQRMSSIPWGVIVVCLLVLWELGQVHATLQQLLLVVRQREDAERHK
jgi:hypothetical protein